MDTLGKRVKKVIAYHGTTMTSFAKEINISQSMVSKICADKAVPSDRTISDICRIYNIRKEWILHGTGEMLDTQSLENELADCFGKSDLSLSEDVKQNLIYALVNTPPAAWHIIVDHIKKLSEEYKKNPESVSSYMDGYREGVRTAQSIVEMFGCLYDKPKE